MLLANVANTLMMTKADLIKFALTMPRRYKKYKIPKRNGQGTRLIAQPSKESKLIQRILVEELRDILPIHEAATAYEKGTGILVNARRHIGSRYLLKMDFKDFFPSIVPDLFLKIAETHNIVFDDLDEGFLRNALFYRNTRRSQLRLSIGAPSSPFISNFVMSKFDSDITSHCLKNEVSYTRYADDLTFSTNRKGILFEFPEIIRQKLKDNCYGKIRINSSKTIFSSKAFNRHVTGIVLTNNDQLSLGRHRKREIASLINSFRYGNIDDTGSARLAGLLSHAYYVEADFLSRMRKKYSNSTIDAILCTVERK